MISTAFLTLWWVWIAAALGLATLEVLVPGFVFLGFAIGAALVGVLLLGPIAALSVPFLMLLFAILSLFAWLGLRRVFTLAGTAPKHFDRDIND